MIDTQYNTQKTDYLIKGFTAGFRIGYTGPRERQDKAPNLKLRVGSKVELWNKVMKEVKLERYAGLFNDVPYHNYIQSPIRLVPKDNGKQTRLIFHLSYDFKESGNKSLNYHTPDEVCMVKYNDLDHAVDNCLRLLKRLGDKQIIYFAKTNVRSDFRLVGLSPEDFCWLVLMAEHPTLGKKCYFVDKCLPFGASISCAIFQTFSDTLAHILQVWTQCAGEDPDCLTNYLDDFLFLSYMKALCDELVQRFLRICEIVKCPIALEKTEWESDLMVFLGILLDGRNHLLAIPEAKRVKTTNLLKVY